MKDKNLLDDIKNRSLEDLKILMNNLIENLENNKDLEKSIEDYHSLIKINNLIQKRFQVTTKEISDKTKIKINDILSHGKISPKSSKRHK